MALAISVPAQCVHTNDHKPLLATLVHFLSMFLSPDMSLRDIFNLGHYCVICTLNNKKMRRFGNFISIVDFYVVLLPRPVLWSIFGNRLEDTRGICNFSAVVIGYQMNTYNDSVTYLLHMWRWVWDFSINLCICTCMTQARIFLNAWQSTWINIWCYISPHTHPPIPRPYTWWRHQMETFSALLAICAENSPVPGEFPAQRPVTRSFDVLLDTIVRLVIWDAIAPIMTSP